MDAYTINMIAEALEIYNKYSVEDRKLLKAAYGRDYPMISNIRR
jgi:hypothetical protein